jgi:hypothetical protein
MNFIHRGKVYKLTHSQAYEAIKIHKSIGKRS